MISPELSQPVFVQQLHRFLPRLPVAASLDLQPQQYVFFNGTPFKKVVSLKHIAHFPVMSIDHVTVNQQPAA